MKAGILFLGNVDRAMISVIEELLSQRIQVILLNSPDMRNPDLPSWVSFIDENSLHKNPYGNIDFVFINMFGKLRESEKEFMASGQFSSFWINVKKVFVGSNLNQDNNFELDRIIPTFSPKVTFLKSSLFFESLLDLSWVQHLSLLKILHRECYWISAKDFGRQLATLIQVSQNNDPIFYMQGPEKLRLIDFIPRTLTNHQNPKNSGLWISRLNKTLKRAKILSRLRPAESDQGEKFLAQNTWRILGDPVISIEHFLRMIA